MITNEVGSYEVSYKDLRTSLLVNVSTRMKWYGIVQCAIVL